MFSAVSPLCRDLAVLRQIKDKFCGFALGFKDFYLDTAAVLELIFARPKTVTHSSTNRAQRRVTSFMRRTTLPLRLSGGFLQLCLRFREVSRYVATVLLSVAASIDKRAR